MKILLLALVLGCKGAEDDTGGDSGDTSDTSDTGDTSDTSDTSDTDTGDTSDSGCPSLCDALSCTVDLDLHPVTLSGSVTWDGGEIANSRAEPEWDLRLSGNGRIWYPQDGATSYSVQTLPGTWDVDVLLRDWNAVSTPSWGWHRVADDLELSADATLDIAVQTALLSGTVSYDGGAIGDTSGGTEWSLLLENQSGDSFTYTLDGAGSYAVRVPRDTWDVRVSITDKNAVGTWIEGWAPVAEDVAVTGDTTLDLEVTLASLSGTVTYDGAPIGDTDVDDEWRLDLVSPEGFWARVPLGPGGSYSVEVFPGTWDVDFSLASPGAVTSPAAGRTRVASGLVVSGATGLNVAVSTGVVSGAVTLDGATVENPGYLRFRDTVTGTDTYENLTGQDSYAVTLFQGSYDVDFAVNTLPWTAPVATGLSVTGATPLDVTPTTATLSGDLSYDGQVIGYDDDDGGPSIRLGDPVRGTTSNISLPGDQDTYAINVYEGTWDVGLGVWDSIVDGAVDGWGRVSTSQVVSGDTTLDIGPSARAIGGIVAWDEDGLEGGFGLELHDLETGNVTQYTAPGDAEWYAGAAWPGTYSVWARFFVPGEYYSYTNQPTRILDCVRVDPDTGPWRHTLTIDGDPGDWLPAERFETSQGRGTDTRISWDDDTLYVGVRHPDVASGGNETFLLVYVGNGTAGTTEGVLHNTQQPTLDFEANHLVRWKADDSWSALDTWTGTEWEITTAPYLGDTATPLVENESEDFVEFAVPLADLGVTDTLSLYVTWIYEGDGSETTYAQTPSDTYQQGAYDPDYNGYFAFDLAGTVEPALYRVSY